MRIRYTILGLLACLAAPLGAQYGPVQDSTLIGLRRVVLNLNTTLKGPRTFRDDVALELRKAGIRVAPDSAAFDANVDAVMNVLVRAGRGGGGCGDVIRIDVEQQTRLVRTGKVHRTVTWFYEDDGDGRACGDGWLEPALKRAVNAFLTRWLDMNGR